MKKNLVTLAAAAGIAGLVLLAAYMVPIPIHGPLQATPAAAAAPVQAQPGWQKPSPQLQSDDDDLRAFQQEVLKEQSAIESMKAIKHYQVDLDRRAGLNQRVQQEARNEAPQHPGMVFDLDAGYWVPNPHPEPPPADPALGNAAKPPAAAVPTPSPKK